MSVGAIPSVIGQSDASRRREQRLNAVIAEYLAAAQSGRAPDRQAFLERHWDLTDGLVSFFANEDRLKQFAGVAGLPGNVAAPADSAAQTAHSPDHLPWHDAGDFEIMNEIASGGMGVVYKARDKKLNRIVALKTILPGALRPSEEMVRRLRIEANVVAALDHPNIVPLYDIGERDGYPYLILKLIPGGDLERHVSRLRKKPREVARLMARVARTVQYAHQRGVLHRDLKPSNILLDLQGEPHVTDFGLAKDVAVQSGLTQTGLILGTPAYMAPEQVSGGSRNVTVAADIYGLGAILYKLLTGRPPFHAATVYELLDQVRNRQPRPLREHNRHIDRALEAICLKCLEKEPGRRYHSAAALAADLERWRAGSVVFAEPLCASERASRWYYQNRKDLAISAGLLGLVTIFVLAAVATATIICRYELADEPSRAAPERMEARRSLDAKPALPHDGTPAQETVSRGPARSSD